MELWHDVFNVACGDVCNPTQVPFLSLHGKVPAKMRTRTFHKFNDMATGVLLCTVGLVYSGVGVRALWTPVPVEYTEIPGVVVTLSFTYNHDVKLAFSAI